MGCSEMTSFFWGTLTSPPLNTHHFFTFSIARSKRQGDKKYISVINYYTNKRKWRLCQHCAAISPYRGGWRRVPVNFYDRASSYSILSFRYSLSENHLEEENMWVLLTDFGARLSGQDLWGGGREGFQKSYLTAEWHGARSLSWLYLLAPTAATTCSTSTPTDMQWSIKLLNWSQPLPSKFYHWYNWDPLKNLWFALHAPSFD